jgi:hypothetical protein
MRLPLHVLVVASACLVCLADRAAGGQAAYVKRTDSNLALGNEFLELRLATSGSSCSAVQLVNRLSGRTIPIQSDGLSIGIEGRPAVVPAACVFQQARDEAIPGGRRLVLPFTNDPNGLRIEVVYELADKDFFLRRRLEVTAAKPLPLRQVDVWLAKLAATCTHDGYGEPVFLDDTFWGLEYPGGHDGYEGGTVRLTQFPGRTIDGRFVSKTAVLGVAEPAGVVRRFRQYVETFQATPKETSIFVNYNTWWTLMPPTEKNCLALIEQWRRELFEPYGESFDTFTIDDGWDDKNSLWKLRADRFPNGFGPLIAPLKAMKAKLGLWLSPSSGYNHAPWGAANGYERNSNEWFLCQSGPKYRGDIVKVVTSLAREYDLAFYKFDGFSASCEAQGHGHLPGNFAKEANIDAYLELLTAVRQARPGVYLDPTCGMWLSPWWLRYVDSIWGNVSGDYPDIRVPGPILRDSATTTRDGVFRQRCAEHPGYPPAAIEHLGIIVITDEKWQDNAMAVVARGCRLLTLYIDPKHFRNGQADWAFLASLLKWVRHNAQTLSRTELLGGDPFQREPYGYAHFAGGRGILSLRNPFIEPRTVRVKLDESVGWPRAEAEGSFIARIVYPRQEVLSGSLRHGDVLEVALQGYEMVILHVEPASAAGSAPAGIAAQVAERAGNQVRFALYGRPGQQFTLPAARIARATLDGQPLPAAAASTSRPAVALPGTARPCVVEQPHLAVQTLEESWSVEGTCIAVVPDGTAASMHVLCDPRGGSAGVVQCSALVAGKPVPVRAVVPSDPAQAAQPWIWFEFPLPAGRSAVAISIKPAGSAAPFRGELGWWLWAEHPLQKSTLTIELAQPPPPAASGPLPLPVEIARQRQIVTVQAPKVFRLARQWPKDDRRVVYLDEVPPDETTQGWGVLQSNLSVWEKKMVVAGREFSRGLGTHANGRILYDLSGHQFRTFCCLVGRDAHAVDGKVVFQVKLDGKIVFDSGPMTKDTAAKVVEVNVANAAELELLTLDGGDGNSGDHGDWADAKLLR